MAPRSAVVRARAQLVPMAWTPFSVAAPDRNRHPRRLRHLRTRASPGRSTCGCSATWPGKRILDLGCGAGRNAVALARAGRPGDRGRRVGRPDRPCPGSASTPPTYGSSSTTLRSPNSPSCGPTPSTPPSASAPSPTSPTSAGSSARLHRVLRPEHAFVARPPAPDCSPCSIPTPRIRSRSGARPSTRSPSRPSDPRTGMYDRSMRHAVHRARPSRLPGRHGARTAADQHRRTALVAGDVEVPPTLILRGRKEGI